ncbi:MAG: hypothetical protein CL834_05860 [Crocinitomicaceae bacterium]|jgi:nicotinamide riboside kinase|nr:hypothetical protein [Crocinitomicaceae bacterium]|tara:strand:+ start:363 stop:923 length:561 start_codon:yes stop_codon:yes gene_type:complete
MVNPVIRIAISGIESTGKTTLTAALAAAISAETAVEVARYDPRVQKETIGLSDLTRLAVAQLEACHAAEQRAEAAEKKIVISDSDSTVIRLWGRWKLRAEVCGLSELEEWADLTLLCAPNIPWEPDPLRSLPDSNDRMELHQLYIDDLRSRNDHPWTLIDGLTQEKRLEQSVRAVQSFRDTSVSNG